MYKDVWKKFGGKILIVLCSVLLLGGVAFAAPRLQAADDLVSLKDVKISPESPTTGPSIYIDDSKIKYSIDTNSGEPQERLPQAFDYMDAKGNKKTSLVFSTYFTKTNTTNANKVGTATIEFIARDGNGLFKYDVEKKTVSYKISKEDIYAFGVPNYTISGDGFLKAGKDGVATLRDGDLNIYLDLKGGKRIEITEYHLVTDTFRELGSNTAEVIFDNYLVGSDEEYPVTFNVKKSVGDLEVWYKEDGVDHPLSDFNKEQGQVPQGLFLKDNGVEVPKSEYTLFVSGGGSSNPSVHVKANDISAKYYGEADFYYTVQAKNFDVRLPDDFYDNGSNVSYNESRTDGLGYIKKPEYLIDKETGNSLFENTDYEILTDNDFAIIDGSDVIAGATAGVVRIRVNGKGDYQGSSCDVMYMVSRSLNNGKVAFETKPPVSEMNYEYDDGETHRPDTIIYFKDSPDYKLVLNDDYTIEYRNLLAKNSQMVVDDTAQAGTVTIEATGRGTETGSGYYGTVTLNDYYNIKRKNISAETGYSLNLNPNVSAANANRFLYTGESLSDAVTENAIVKRDTDTSGNYIQISTLKKGEDYDIYFSDKDGNSISETEVVEIGGYTVEYFFHGNYTGTLKANFTIYTRPLSECTITVLNCDDEVDGAKHIYNKLPHEPKVRVTYLDREGGTGNSIIIPESAYEIVGYANNIEPGTASVTIRGKASSSDVRTVPFKIESTSLGNSDIIIRLPREYGGIEKKHPYVGKEKPPALNTVIVNGVELNLGVDYEVVSLCTADDELPITSSTYPKINKDYKFKIKGKGSFTGEGFTETFQLIQKDINDESIEYAGLDRTDRTGYTQAQEENYVNTYIELKDTEFGDTLDKGADYIIETGAVVDKKGENGTVEVTITTPDESCYTGTKTIAYKVGYDIAEAEVFDKNNTPCTVDPVTGQLWLKQSYTEQGVNFATEDGSLSTKVYLKFGTSNLFRGKQYEAIFNSLGYIDTADGSKPYAVATLTGKNGYYGTREIYFYITQKSLRDVRIEIVTHSALDLTYSGYEIEPEIRVIDSDDNIVDPDDYSVSFSNNVHAGTATVTIRGKRGYTESKSTTFQIEQRDISDEAYVWIDGNEGMYKYSKNTTEDGHLVEGVRPQVQIRFDPDGRGSNGPMYYTLVKHTDYEITYGNNLHVWVESTGSGADLSKRPYMTVTGMGRDFKGTITAYFQITPINLRTECDVIVLNPESVIFNGLSWENNIKVEVRMSDSQSVVPEEEYEVHYTGEPTFISGPLENQKPRIEVVAKPDGNCINDAYATFTIFGNLDPRAGTKQAENSQITVKSNPVPYSVDGNYDPKTFLSILFEEKEDGTNVFTETVRLEAGEDYTIQADTSTVGSHIGTITGTGRFFGIISAPVVIRGNLGESYTTFTDPGDIAVDGTPEDPGVYLARIIAPVVCGGKTLEYGIDYTFNETPDMSLKTHEITIIPTPDAEEAGYLTGSCKIKYTVKQGIEGFYVDGLNNLYEYKHGDPVITKDDFKVYTDNTKQTMLHYGTDYEISDESKLIECGEGYLVIVGKGNYAGSIPNQYFEIVRYNLRTNHEAGNLDISWNKKPEYTGGIINTEDLQVVIKTSDGQYTIDPSEYNISVATDTGADYVNRTKENAAIIPTFKIVARNINYTDTIEDASFEFRIQPKRLTSDLFSLPDQVEYHEKDVPPPAPTGVYNGVEMKGTRYQTADQDYEGYDFTYTYSPTDTKTGGEKSVIITGHGNFIGDVTLTYVVTKKNIDDSDVVLTLTTPEPYVYNGNEQRPAFELTYEEQSILIYDGNSIISTRLSNPAVTYENNMNAGRAVIHITTNENDPNYTGQKDYTFAIEKLVIDNHIRFLWSDSGENLSTYKLELPRAKDWEENGGPYVPKHLESAEEELPQDDNSYVRVYYNGNGINNLQLWDITDYTIDRYYVEPDTEDTRIRAEYDNQDFNYAGKVKVTITGTGNYTGTACYWYYIGTDISADGTCRLQKTTTVFNAQQQWPVEIVNGLDSSKYLVVRYRHAVTEENILGERGADKTAFFDADTYYIRIEGNPRAGTYSSSPIQLTYTITPRSINHVLIDGYKAEYSYTGSAICPVGLTVTDPIDDIRYKLTEDKDYTISYSNNINAGVASIIVKGQGNYDASTTATARFTITSSTISGGSGGNGGGGVGGGSSSNGSSGQLSGSSTVTADDVRLTMDTSDAMYYTGDALYPGVYIAGMTENIDYALTYSNNINVGQGIITIRGINNSSGVITKTFKIIAQLSKCTVAEIPDQAHTGLPVTPGVTITCGPNTLLQGTDYTLSYANNVNIGTASVIITAVSGSNYTGSVTVNFSIGNGISSAVVSGYASHYTYTGQPITPAISVVAGATTLRQGTDYTVEYENNTNAGTATITITGKGEYSGTKKVTFVIEPKNISSCTTTDVSSKRYTGDAYTPSVTVSDGGKVLTNGVDYTITYTNNTNPGIASIIIRGMSNNYSGTKTINFRIATVAVSGLRAGAIKSTSLTLAWTAQDYASGYQVCDANSRVIRNITTNRVTLTGLTSGKTYKYKVRSYIRKDDGTRAYGSFSTVVTATTKLKTPTLKAASKAKGRATVRWSKITGATGYQIFYSTSPNSGYKKLKTVKNTVRTLNIKGLKSGQRYFFRVRAYKKVGSKNIYSNYNSLKAITVK